MFNFQTKTIGFGFSVELPVFKFQTKTSVLTLAFSYTQSLPHCQERGVNQKLTLNWENTTKLQSFSPRWERRSTRQPHVLCVQNRADSLSRDVSVYENFYCLALLEFQSPILEIPGFQVVAILYYRQVSTVVMVCLANFEYAFVVRHFTLIQIQIDFK